MEDSIIRNQVQWTTNAPSFVEAGRRSWAGEPSWGVWGIPESDVGILPDVDGKDTIELGCGTAYVSPWLARRGARPVGVDPATAQLANARLFQNEFALSFPLVRVAGEHVPAV